MFFSSKNSVSGNCHIILTLDIRLDGNECYHDSARSNASQRSYISRRVKDQFGCVFKISMIAFNYKQIDTRPPA